MPQIIVIADKASDEGGAPIMFRERVTVTDFESQHFAHQLVERIGWAVGDADEMNRRAGRAVRRVERRKMDRRLPDGAERELVPERELAFSGSAAQPVS